MIIKRIPHRRFSSFGCLADDICAPPHDPERIRIFPPRNGLPPAPTTSHPREALVLIVENAHQAWWNLTGLRDQDLTMHLVISYPFPYHL